MDSIIERKKYLKERKSFIESLLSLMPEQEEKFHVKDGNIDAFRAAVQREYGVKKFSITKTNTENTYIICRS